MSHVVYYNEGLQPIRTVPIRNGRAVVVASGTYEIKDLRYPESSASHVLASGSVTVDSVSTTTTAAAGRSTTDPRQVSVASAAGISAGRQYLLRYGGRDELVTVEGVSGTTVRLRHEVRAPFATGASFLGIEVSCSIPSEVTADDVYLGTSLVAVRWELDDLAPLVEQVFLERASVAPIVSRADVLSLDSTLAAYDGEGLGLDQAIVQAVSDLRIDLLSSGFDDSRYLTGPIGKEAIKHAAAFHTVKHSTNESAVRRAEHYRTRYGELRSNLLTGLAKEKTANLDSAGAKAPIDYHSMFLVQW